MIELYALKTVKDAKDSDDLTSAQKTGLAITWTVMLVVYVLVLVFAIHRAMRCSFPPLGYQGSVSAGADSRALHLLFAVTNPIFYILFSYLGWVGLC